MNRDSLIERVNKTALKISSGEWSASYTVTGLAIDILKSYKRGDMEKCHLLLEDLESELIKERLGDLCD